MKTASLTNALTYNEKGVAVSVLLETETTKEVRIVMKKGQVMKEHKTPFPIVVELFEGSIDFGVNGEKHALVKGDMISLDGSVPHNLLATNDTIIRLSLSKLDSTDRVKDVAQN